MEEYCSRKPSSTKMEGGVKIWFTLAVPGVALALTLKDLMYAKLPS